MSATESSCLDMLIKRSDWEGGVGRLSCGRCVGLCEWVECSSDTTFSFERVLGRRAVSVAGAIDVRRFPWGGFLPTNHLYLLGDE